MSTLEVSAPAVSGPRGGEVARLAPWFHNLHLPDGTETAPQHSLGDFPAVKWRQIAPHVPERLDGLTALDVGCNAGFYSFELARRGARVTAIDIDEHYLAQARWAAREFGLDDRIELGQLSVYDLARTAEQYDLVLFLGVLYHLRHPLLALDVLQRITRGQLILQTLTMPGERVFDPPPSIGLDERALMQRPGWPRMAFIERALEDDPTNWWAPDHACVEAMLRAAGFHVSARPGHEIYVCAPLESEPPIPAALRAAELRAVFAIPGEPP
ncbi:MAG TPA: TIGR04290 family methyltransferase [Steroidobacteraceae bacterium]|nr:TIGR04290 family methyltransferase [Steroidobacteraceae bacterium]